MSTVIQADVEAAEKALSAFHDRMWASIPAAPPRGPDDPEDGWKHYVVGELPYKDRREYDRLVKAYDDDAINGRRINLVPPSARGANQRPLRRVA